MKKIFLIVLGLFISISAYSQSQDVITEILESSEATFGQVCYISAVMQSLVSDDSSYDDAVLAVYENEQLPYITESSQPIPLIDAAYLFSFMWDIKGGLMYKITNGAPRYVFKQFQVDKIIPYDAEPNQIVSGIEIMRMFTSCEKKYGDPIFTQGGNE